MKTFVRWTVAMILAVMAFSFIAGTTPQSFNVKSFSDYPNGAPFQPSDIVLVQRGNSFVNCAYNQFFTDPMILPGSLTVGNNFTNIGNAYLGNVTLSGTFTVANVVVANPPYLNGINITNISFYQMSAIPTNFIPTSDASHTNWGELNLNGVMYYVATNNSAGGWLYVKSGTITLSP